MCRAFGAGTGAHFAMSAAAYYTKWVIVVDEDVAPDGPQRCALGAEQFCSLL
jgi:hypothetical protein